MGPMKDAVHSQRVRAKPVRLLNRLVEHKLMKQVSYEQYRDAVREIEQLIQGRHVGRLILPSPERVNQAAGVSSRRTFSHGGR